MVILHTTMGDITLKLNAEKAPLSVANFLQYVATGYYNNTLFHRVINGFMIQGGGLNEDMTDKSSILSHLTNEADNTLKNKRGSIAMARTTEPHSATSQFFINVEDNSFLNYTTKTQQGWGYAVFGQVIQGMDTVDKIRQVKTCNRAGHQDVPSEPILITSVEVVTTPEKSAEPALS